MTTLYCAQWVLPVSSAAVEDGAVAVERTRIAAVGPREQLAAQFPGAACHDFGEAAILPGLVNCHTHLELTAMRGYLEREESDFFRWLRKLTKARLELLTPDDVYASAAWGAVEAARAGITCVGDASDQAAAALAALRDIGLRGIVYQEVFGPDPSTASEQIAKLKGKVERLRAAETDLVRVGVSPHAPYTVSAALVQAIADYAISNRLAVMMHAVESRAETLLMREGRGPFAEGLAGRGIVWHAPGISTVQYLNGLGVLQHARPLLAHCITVDEQDIETLAATGARVAHCPKSNAKLGHGIAPYKDFLKRGVKTGLGSDSVASNNTCDLLEEARFAMLLARAHTSVNESLLSVDDALATATLGGARALGMDHQTGVLAEGMQADLIVVALDGEHQLPVFDPASALIGASSGRDVRLTVVAGREIYRDGRVTTLDEERLRARMKEIATKLRVS